MAPVVVHFKVFFQDLCEAKMDWDQLLTDDLLKRWQSLLSRFDGHQHVMIPRYFLDGVGQEGAYTGFVTHPELHMQQSSIW